MLINQQAEQDLGQNPANKQLIKEQSEGESLLSMEFCLSLPTSDVRDKAIPDLELTSIEGLIPDQHNTTPRIDTNFNNWFIMVYFIILYFLYTQLTLLHFREMGLQMCPT